MMKLVTKQVEAAEKLMRKNTGVKKKSVHLKFSLKTPLAVNMHNQLSSDHPSQTQSSSSDFWKSHNSYFLVVDAKYQEYNTP